MAGNITFTMIKPGAVSHEHIGQILTIISAAGYWISAMKMVKLSTRTAEEFYKVHCNKPFYRGLIDFMSSGPIVVAILEKENAVEDYRKLMGATDPTKAEHGTIRRMFGTNIQANAVHGSDSDENARIESDFFFSMSERFNKDASYSVYTY